MRSLAVFLFLGLKQIGEYSIDQVYEFLIYIYAGTSMSKTQYSRLLGAIINSYTYDAYCIFVDVYLYNVD